MANISPGVYTQIRDLSNYVQVVPSSTGFICFLSEKGEDNIVKFIGSRQEFLGEFGSPDINYAGKNYSQGPYFCSNFLEESGSLYAMRCLPSDAQFSNFRIDATLGLTDATATISVTYVDSLNSKAEMKTSLVRTPGSTTYPICFIYPIGRGAFYNNIGVRFIAHSNPMLNDVYVMDIYEKQTDGDEIIIESFEVSFNPNAKDDSGDSIFIEYILNTYSSILRADLTLSTGGYSEGYDLIARVFDKEIGSVSVTLTDGSADITDNKQDFSDWETDPETGYATYIIVAMDNRGNKLYGYLGAASGSDEETISVFNGRDLDTATQSWIGTTASFDDSGEIFYIIKKSYSSIATAFTSSTPVPLKKGSDGSLFDSSGDFSTTVGTATLVAGYGGILVSPEDGSSYVDDMLDPEKIFIDIIFDCGYPSDVKTYISNLVQTREDCMAILDNGDNATYTAARNARIDTHTFNNFYTAIFESYNKIYDEFTGQDIWVSPCFHMSYLLPRHDSVNEVWSTAAGFDGFIVEKIKELRFNPSLSQRDQLYLKQINPIVKFINDGYVYWGQLTTQTKASALQDINIVRLVLYCKRALERYCRYYIYKFNDAITWNAVASDVVAFLGDIKERRGLYDFNVRVYATDYMKKQKRFAVEVTLNPTRVTEQIDLRFFIT